MDSIEDCNKIYIYIESSITGKFLYYTISNEKSHKIYSLKCFFYRQELYKEDLVRLNRSFKLYFIFSKV